MLTKLNQLLQQIQQAHKEQNMQQMKRLCNEVLAIDNHHFETHLILSQLYLQQNQYLQAIPHLKKYLLYHPSHRTYLQQLALAYFNCKQYSQCQKSIDSFLSFHPPEHWCFYLSGLISQQENDSSGAIHYLKQALKLNPEQPEYHNNLAVSLQANNQKEEALIHYKLALKIKPDYTEALFNIGLMRQQEGDLNQAIHYFEKALTLEPQNKTILYHAGQALHEAGELSEAIIRYETLLNIEPNRKDILYALANTNQSLKDNEKARYYYQQLLKIDPHSPSTNLLMGHLMVKQSDIEQAMHFYSKSCLLNPENKLWRLTKNNVCPPVLESRKARDSWISHWKENLKPIALNSHLEEIMMSGAEFPLNLHYYFPEDKLLRTLYANQFSIKQPPFQWNKKPPHKLGILITPAHEGVFLKLSRYLLEHWKNRNINIVIIAPQISLNIIKKYIQNPLITYLPLPLQFKAAMDTILKANLTFLYYWEIGTDSFNYFLAFFRLAPIQFTSWGIGMTSGISTIDYYLSHPLVEPDNYAIHYSEKLYLFQNAFPTTYDRSHLHPTPFNRSHFGFEKHWNLYIYPHNLRKLHPDFDPYLEAILYEDPNAHIILLDSSLYLTKQLKKRLKQSLYENYSRLHFLPRQTYSDYLGLLILADVVLGSLYIGGGNVVYETLGLNQPMISYSGQTIKGRFAAACYKIMNLPQMIARDQKEYVNLALQMAQDKTWKKEIEMEIKQHKSKLFSHQHSLKCWEEFLHITLKQQLE